MRFIFYALLYLPIICFSQFGNQDFGVWGGIELESKINKELKFSGSIESRTEDNSSSLKQAFTDLGLKYKINKHIYTSVNWRSRLLNQDYGYVLQNRYSIDLTGKLKVGSLFIYLRSRTQYQFKKNDLNDSYERIRLKLAMKMKDGVKFFIQDEFFFHLNSFNSPFYDKNRFGVGMEYEISKSLAIAIKYLRITEVNVYYPLKMNVIGMNVSYSL